MSETVRPSGLRRLVAAGAALALGATLAACGSADAGPPQLTWYINPDNGGQAQIAQQCSDEADGAYTITTSLLPRDAASQREQLARRLAAGDRSLDIMSLDPPYIPELAEPGFLAPVPEDLVTSSTQDVVDGAVQGATWNDELVAVPFWANTQLLWYRESVAEEAGLDMSEPVTWDQLIEAAETTDSHLGIQGIRAESMTVWVNALYESQGQSIIENPGAPADETQLALDSPAGDEASRIIGTIGAEGLAGPGATTQDENVAMAQFQGEQGSFMVNWPFVYTATQTSVEQGSVDQEVLDDMKWTTYPQVSEDQESAPPLGGINLGVGASSEHQDLAYEAIRCIVSPDKQAQYFLSDGNPPASTTAYQDPEVQDAYPMAPVIRESLERAAPRPQTPFYNEISLGIQQHWTPISEVGEATPARSQEFIQSVLRGEALL
ncbi:extracellular solute-binding protein [Brachybacterium paraconglomeratum]|uniref:extracellular solute-binding protein n=1 Tax=Brachybacterium TaxID=43668 RepID=UPI003242327C